MFKQFLKKYLLRKWTPPDNGLWRVRKHSRKLTMLVNDSRGHKTKCNVNPCLPPTPTRHEWYTASRRVTWKVISLQVHHLSLFGRDISSFRSLSINRPHLKMKTLVMKLKRILKNCIDNMRLYHLIKPVLTRDIIIYIYIYIYIYWEMIAFDKSDKMIKISWKVDKVNPYNRLSTNISFFIQGRTSSDFLNW